MLRTRVKSAEKALAGTTSMMLTGVALKYGKDSSKYEMAGGTRQSERRKRSVSQSVAAEAVPV